MNQSNGLRLYFGLECLVWAGWLLLDLLTFASQLEVARMMNIRGMVGWFVASVVINLAMVVICAIGARHGAGAFSRRLSDGPRQVVVALGIVFRIVLGLAMAVWLTTMSGAQSV